MRDDEAMDRLLTDALAAPAPALSAGFDDAVLRRMRPSHLTRPGRLVIAVYAVLAVAATAWFMREMPIEAIVATTAVSLPAAIGASAYARRLAFGSG